jgi:hypothetical protein
VHCHTLNGEVFLPRGVSDRRPSHVCVRCVRLLFFVLVGVQPRLWLFVILVAMQALLALIFGVLTLQGCKGCAVEDGYDMESSEYKDSDLGKCIESSQKRVEDDAGEDVKRSCEKYQILLDCMGDCCDVKPKGDDTKKLGDESKALAKMLNEATCADNTVTDPCAR